MAVLILIVFCIQPTNELRGGGVWFTIGQNNRFLNCLIHFTNDRLEHAVDKWFWSYVWKIARTCVGGGLGGEGGSTGGTGIKNDSYIF